MGIEKLVATVVAKTRMGQNLCVGAVEEQDGRSIRLIPGDSPDYHGWRSFEPEIGDRLILEGEPSRKATPPHVEDFLVRSYSATGRRESGLVPWIKERCNVWRSVPSLFDGRLEQTRTGSRYVEEGEPLPRTSVGFWELPFALYVRDDREGEKRKLSYVAAQRYGFRVSYVGLEEPIETIPHGTLVRVSLARWWAREKTASKRCWLQLSGWFT